MTGWFDIEGYHRYYAEPTNYTSIGVSVGGGHEALLSGNQLPSPPSRLAKIEEPQTAVSIFITSENTCGFNRNR